MRDIFITVVFLAVIPYCFAHAEFALSLWYWASLFQPQTQTWGFARSIPFSFIAAGVAIIAWLFRPGRKLPNLSPLVVSLLLLGVWTGVTTLNAVFFDAALNEWNLFLRLLLMILIGIALVKTKRELDILIWTICASIGFYGLKIGLFALKGGLGENIHGPSYMNGNNEIARAMIMFLPLLVYLYWQTKQLWLRAGIVSVGIGSTVLLVLSGSRGAWLGAAAMVLFVALRAKRGLLLVAGAALIACVVVPFLPERIVDRFMSMQEFETDNSVQGRIGSWKYAFDEFPSRPIAGGGFKVFDLEHKKASHNAFIQMLGEHGSVGLVLYLALLTTASMATISIRRRTKNVAEFAWANHLAFCLQLSLVGYSVGSVSINTAFFPIFYAIIGVLESTRLIVQHAPLQTTSVPRPPWNARLKWRANDGSGDLEAVQ